METMTCKVCDARYRVREMVLIMRDIDSFNCEVCMTQLHRWNGAVTYSFERLSDETDGGTGESSEGEEVGRSQ